MCEGWHRTYSFGLSRSTTWLLWYHNNMTALEAWRGGALPGPHRRLLARRWLPAEQCCGLFSRDLVVQTSTGSAASEMHIEWTLGCRKMYSGGFVYLLGLLGRWYPTV
jgi:hypothetical protein